ncbi:hypothetical protein BN946_scf184908.g41 [Trametes cinnabarina]|uniref:CID domain-containing protein n=1 Tax=Pycnoporus cinnabarinus TaxID=5643 RepID=A0A060SGF0_PYCCI|nr:hypothetical protein BN946_scf184908.g41 [Trametes cinnabarina]
MSSPAYHAYPQGYGAAMPSANVYYPPPPPSQSVYQFFDPNTFRRDYVTRLSNLTVNSRPIIQNLSMVAQEYTRFADVVVQCIDQHIRRVPAWMKLPAFYLLDAISKNVYDPYARHFAPIVANLFIETYEAVDVTTRSKMEEMLLTWRTGAPNGRELFGVVPQLAIEQHIWGSGSAQTAPGNRASSSSIISQAQVLSELEFVLGQKERLLHANPYDKSTQHHVAILQQLRALVQVGVSQEELKQILAQLRSLSASSPPASVPVPAPPLYAAPPAFAPPPPLSAGSAAPLPSYSQHPSYPVPSEQVKAEPIDMSRFMTAQQTQQASASLTSAAPPVSDITNLFNALVKAGVVPSSGTPSGTPKGAGASSQPEAQPQVVEDAARDSRHDYRKLMLSYKVKLTSTDIIRQRPPIVNLLYDSLPTQCKQCGVRFPSSTSGKKQFEDHLDMHFRQNRKASQAVGRGYSRSWFISLDDWIHGDSVDVKGKGRADGRTSSSKVAAAEEAAQRDAELRAMHVVVPPGDEAKPISCPICKEHLKSEFLEDEEEWVWRNAVTKDDRIYHATCHAEAVASKSTLAVRLRNETSSRSRSRTPERLTPPKALSHADSRMSESPSPSRLAGMKRKAEEEGSQPSSSEAEAPHVKRQAT